MTESVSGQGSVQYLFSHGVLNMCSGGESHPPPLGMSASAAVLATSVTGTSPWSCGLDLVSRRFDGQQYIGQLNTS